MATIWRIARWVNHNHSLEAFVQAVVGPKASGCIDTEATGEVAEQAENLRKSAVAVRKSAAPVQDSCGAPEVAGQHGGEAAQCEVCTRISLLKAGTGLREFVDVRSEVPRVAIRAEVVSAKRADTDQHDITAWTQSIRSEAGWSRDRWGAIEIHSPWHHRLKLRPVTVCGRWRWRWCSWLGGRSSRGLFSGLGAALGGQQQAKAEQPPPQRCRNRTHHGCIIAEGGGQSLLPLDGSAIDGEAPRSDACSMARIKRWIPALLRTLVRGVFLYCGYYSFLALGVPLLRAFELTSPISPSGICWSMCVVIYAVELAKEWPRSTLQPYTLAGPVARHAPASPRDWVPRSRSACRPRRGQGLFGGGWQSPHRQVRFGRTALR